MRMINLLMYNTLPVVITLSLAILTSLSSESIRNYQYEKLQQANVHLYCKSVPSNIMLRCLSEGRSVWVVGCSNEHCLICYFDDTEPEFKLFNGSKESFLWMTQSSKFYDKYC